MALPASMTKHSLSHSQPLALAAMFSRNLQMPTASRQVLQIVRCRSSGSMPSTRIPTGSPQCAHRLMQSRQFVSSPTRLQRQARRPSPPKTPVHERAPASKETTQTDFAAMDVLRDFAAPATSIEMTMQEGFALNNGQVVTDGSGLMLVGGDGIKWRPWLREGGKAQLVNSKGQWEVDKEAWGVLALTWPKPDLLIIGTGQSIRPLSPATRKDINDLGIRVDVQDTRNAAAQFNLLATERGVQQIAAALVPLGNKNG